MLYNYTTTIKKGFKFMLPKEEKNNLMQWQVQISKRDAEIINEFIRLNNLTNERFLQLICAHYVHASSKRRKRLFEINGANKYGKRTSNVDRFVYYKKR